MPEQSRTCGDAGGRRVSGEPCGGTIALSETNGLCAFHDPDRAEHARAVRAAGSASGPKRPTRRAALPAGMPLRPPKTLEDAVTWSAWAMHAVAAGTISERVGHEIGYLVNAFKAAVEKRDLQKQIDELRAQLAQAHERMRRPGLTAS
jgi:hypothetical protein